MEQLAWLPAHPDLSAALRAARAATDPAARLACAAALAGYRRDVVATERLDRLAAPGLEAAARGDRPGPEGLMPARVAILSSHTVDHLLPAIRVAGLGRRLAVALHVAPYGLYRQALLERDEALAAFAPHLILLALDARDAPLDLPLDAPEADVAGAVEARVEELRRLWRVAREWLGAQVVQQTLVPVDEPLFGLQEALMPAAPGTLVQRLNAALRGAARADGVLLLDLAAVAARGAEGLADPVLWHHAKQLVGPRLAPLYGDLVARVAAAAKSLSRKCLVLDLDDTLWGGVAGDDGVDGLRLGCGSAEGEAFLAFQRHLALLGRRGIILAVCSKNDAAVAEAAFAHPEMALRREDVAAFVANWDDKPGNLRRIAGTLGIGLDALVFVDDNPAERDIVRRELPEVAVPELPDDVAHYPARLAQAGYFEAAAFTAEDAARGRSYALDARRRAALERSTDLEGYLRDLAMSLRATPIGPAELARAAQLVNKTNQFNLTTRRHSEAEMERWLAAPGTLGLALRLKDRFGDNGLIGVILACPDAEGAEDDLVIDTWLMSCRVLGRGVERAALGVLADLAARRGARRLLGEYRPTPRNGLVRDHYAKLGFSPCPPPCPAPPDAAPGTTRWQFRIGRDALPAHPIDVEAIP